jgi:hypothetical protein
MAATNEVTLTGELPAGPFTPAPAVRNGDRLDTALYRFDGVTAHDVVFTMDEVMYLMSSSEFDNCTTGTAPSTGSTSARGGGYTLGDARFEGCTFNRCDFRYFIGFTVDIVDCTFIGTIKSARFGRSMARLEPLLDGMSESFAPTAETQR